MVTESSTIYKLMILYMLNKLDSQLTNAQLSGFFISNDYTDYFTLQQTLSDLVESSFVEKITIRTFFKNQIPKGALEDMNQYLDNNKYSLKNEVGTQADYYKHTNGDYIAHCQVMEGKSLLYEINIAVPSEEEAAKICGNWRGYSEELYGQIMNALLQ